MDISETRDLADIYYCFPAIVSIQPTVAFAIVFVSVMFEIHIDQAYNQSIHTVVHTLIIEQGLR